MSDEDNTSQRETETLDRLYLEWSQFTKARNAREINMATLICRMARRIEQLSPNDTLAEKALDYLKRTSGAMYHEAILRGDQ